jgi:phosphohistidine phosphatase SixA
MRYFSYLLILFIISSCGNTIYIVRHAEKETGIDPSTMKTFTDPPLTLEGQERALKLKEILGGKGITHIYSTNTLRTISTAKPLKELTLGLPISIYNPKPDSTDKFVQMIKGIKKGNILIVGHSNTVDDLCNKIAGSTVVAGDLKDSEYDNLFILKRKGGTYKFKREKYGKPSP